MSSLVSIFSGTLDFENNGNFWQKHWQHDSHCYLTSCFLSHLYRLPQTYCDRLCNYHPSKKVHAQIPSICECYLHMAKGTLQMWFRILRCRNYSGLYCRTNAITNILMRERQENQNQESSESGSRVSEGDITTVFFCLWR